MNTIFSTTCNGMTVSGGALYHAQPCPMHPVCTCPPVPVSATATGATCPAHRPAPMVWTNSAAAVR